MSELVARTVRIDEPLDLVDVAGNSGFLWTTDTAGIAGRGVALKIELPRGLDDGDRVAETLASIRIDQDDVELSGTGPVALGALPFDRDAPGELIVPSVAVGRAPDGTTWLTTVGTDARLPEAPARVPSPSSFTLTSRLPHEEFCRMVEAAVQAIAVGELDKVVLAREVIVEANRTIPVADVLRRLRSLYPSCAVFSMDGFVGASPELLVERRGDHIRSHPLAGTFPRSGDPHADDDLARGLQASMKDRNEHRFVIDAITEVLAPLCRKLVVPDAPSVLPLRNVLHLGTEIVGVLSEPQTALDLVRHLHPTPAIGGTPTAAALRWLAQNEGMERGRYAGPVGWMDAEGDGTFSLGIRSAEISGSTARLFAGVGLVAGSTPESELAETQLKLQALLAAVVRP